MDIFRSVAIRLNPLLRSGGQCHIRPILMSIAIGVLTLGMVVITPPLIGNAPASAVLSQVPSLDGPLTTLLDLNDPDRVRRQEITVDGRPLFSIASPNEDLETRVHSIEDHLTQAKESYLLQRADGGSASPPLRVRQQGQSPTLYYHDQYLFTVTSLDANLYQSTPTDHATVLRDILASAFRRAWQERQPDAIQTQLRQAIALWGIAFSILLGLHYLNRRLYRRYQSQSQADSPQLLIRTRLLNRRQKYGYLALVALLRLGQGGIAIGATMATLNLFPLTRPGYRWAISNLRVYLLMTLVIIGTYILTAVIFSLIDRVLATWLLDPSPIPQRDRRLHQRIITLSRIIKSLTAVTLAIATLIIILVGILGVDVAPVVAGAGLVGVALSLASQNLIRDAIEGILILVEDRYAVGDVVVLKADEIYGLVENITLRVTQLRDPEQRLITVPNGEMRIVANLSSRRSQADLKIPIAYSSNLDTALDIITQESWALARDPDWQALITGDPLILGADEFTSWGIIVRVWIETVPLKQWDIAREYRRRIKRALDEAGIEMARSRAELAWETPPKRT